ncbi:MAG: sigma 54-interacting transcriptional regulator [Lewinella sp.]
MPPVSPNPSSSLHQVAFDLVTEGVLWVDKVGKIRYANAAAAGILGYSRHQLGQSSYLEINPNFSLLGWKKHWKQLDPERGEYLDTQFVNAEGRLFGVRGKVSFDHATEDAPLCLIVFANTEAGRREADLLNAVETHGRIAGFEYNLATGQVYLGPLLREWFGWSPERDFYPVAEFAAKAVLLIGADDQASAKSTIDRLLTTARPFELSITIKTETDEVHRLTLQGQSAENEIEVFKIYGSAREHREQVNSFAGGSETNSAFEFSLDHSLDGIFWIDLADARITYANDRGCELTGFTHQELAGQPAARILPEQFGDQTEALFANLRERKYLEATTNTQRKDGTRYPTRATLHWFGTEDGREMMVVVAHDVSREAEDHEYRQLHTTTLNTLQEWVIWLNAENNVVLMNAAARKKLSRLTTKSLEGLPIGQLMPDLDIPPLTEIRQEQLDGRTRADVDYVYTDSTGKERTLQVRFVQVAADTRLFLSVVCRDVTTEVNNKRRLQEAKRRVDELRKQLESENEALKEEIDTVYATGPIITVSKKYQRILGQIGQVAGTDSTVLVTGETGTGKELLAQSIHNFSNRSTRRMVSVNCAALPENLIESELFGHERGAFTGAFTQKKGKFELASGGTIFLDEIGELPLDMQAKLLRVLQEGEIQRIGSTDVITVDVRVVAATNRNLEKMVSNGTFREDLFYRINVFPIHNLPLRERPEDIPVLVKHFTKMYAEKMGRPVTQINQKDLEQLVAYDFPGNVRELINLVERAVITSAASTLNLGASLRALRRTDRPEGTLSISGDRMLTFEEMQRQYIIEALKRTKGKVTGPGGAAELLDVNGRTLMSKMGKLGIDRGDFSR